MRAQIDDDLASGVWEKMDKADGRSPIPSCSIPCLGGRKRKKKSARSAGDTTQQEGHTDRAVAAAEVLGMQESNALLWRMWRVTSSLVLAQGVWQLAATFTEFVPSIAMQQIIDFVSSYKKSDGDDRVTGRVTLFVVLLFVGPVFQGIADGRNFHLGRRIGCRVGTICKLLFLKTLSQMFALGVAGLLARIRYCTCQGDGVGVE